MVAAKKVTKKQQVVLTKTVNGLGSEGQLVKVNYGYWRNFLQPQQVAEVATADVIAKIEAERKVIEARVAKEREAAQKMANALQTIGKFTIKRKVGEEDKIFGSVTAADVCEAVYAQTAQNLDKKMVTVPANINSLGDYDCTVKLHPDVTGRFTVVVARE